MKTTKLTLELTEAELLCLRQVAQKHLSNCEDPASIRLNLKIANAILDGVTTEKTEGWWDQRWA